MLITPIGLEVFEAHLVLAVDKDDKANSIGPELRHSRR